MKRSVFAVALAVMLAWTASANAQGARTNLVPPQTIGTPASSTPQSEVPAQANESAQQSQTYGQQVIAAHKEGFEAFSDPGSNPVILYRELGRAFPRLAKEGRESMLLQGQPELSDLVGHPGDKGVWVGPKDEAGDRGLMRVSERLWVRTAQAFCLQPNGAERAQISEALRNGNYEIRELRQTDTPMVSGAVGLGSKTRLPVRTIGFTMNTIVVTTPVRGCDGGMYFPSYVVYFTRDDGKPIPPCINVFGVRADTTTATAPPPATTNLVMPDDKKLAEQAGTAKPAAVAAVGNNNRRRGVCGPAWVYCWGPALAVGAFCLLHNGDDDHDGTPPGTTPPPGGVTPPPPSPGKTPVPLPPRPLFSFRF